MYTISERGRRRGNLYLQRKVQVGFMKLPTWILRANNRDPLLSRFSDNSHTMKLLKSYFDICSTSHKRINK